MPAEALLTLMNSDMVVKRHWRVNGRHYAKTLRAWLHRIDADPSKALDVLSRNHGHEAARIQFGRWRIFFMACEELFGYRDGEEWFVGHYRLGKRDG